MPNFTFTSALDKETLIKAVIQFQLDAVKKQTGQEPTAEMVNYYNKTTRDQAANLSAADMVDAIATGSKSPFGSKVLDVDAAKNIGAILLNYEKIAEKEGSKVARPDIEITVGNDKHTLEPKELSAYLQSTAKAGKASYDSYSVGAWLKEYNIALTSEATPIKNKDGKMLTNKDETLFIETRKGERRIVGNGVITNPLDGYYGGVEGVTVEDNDKLDIYLSDAAYNQVTGNGEKAKHYPSSEQRVYVMQQMKKGKDGITTDELKVGFASSADEFKKIQLSTYEVDHKNPEIANKNRKTFKEGQGQYAELTGKQYEALKEAIKGKHDLTLQEFIDQQKAKGVEIKLVATATVSQETLLPEPAPKPKPVAEVPSRATDAEITATTTAYAQKFIGLWKADLAIDEKNADLRAFVAAADKLIGKRTTAEQVGKLPTDPKKMELWLKTDQKESEASAAFDKLNAAEKIQALDYANKAAQVEYARLDAVQKTQGRPEVKAIDMISKYVNDIGLSKTATEDMEKIDPAILTAQALQAATGKTPKTPQQALLAFTKADIAIWNSDTDGIDKGEKNFMDSADNLFFKGQKLPADKLPQKAETKDIEAWIAANNDTNAAYKVLDPKLKAKAVEYVKLAMTTRAAKDEAVALTNPMTVDTIDNKIEQAYKAGTLDKLNPEKLVTDVMKLSAAAGQAAGQTTAGAGGTAAPQKTGEKPKAGAQASADGYKVVKNDTLYKIATNGSKEMNALLDLLKEQLPDAKENKQTLGLTLALILAHKNGISNADILQTSKESGKNLILPDAEDLKIGVAAMKAGILKDNKIVWDGEMKGQKVGDLIPKVTVVDGHFKDETKTR